MILREKGKLLITDPLSKYFPEFAETTVAKPKDGGGYNVVKAKRLITLRDLLTHTAGISYGNGPAADKWKEAGIQGWYFVNRDEPIAATISRIAALPMDAHPSEKFVYGYNTDILDVVIEKVSGKPLDEFISTRILIPFGMKDTQFYLPKDKVDRLATAYLAFPDKPMEPAPTPGNTIGQGAYVEGTLKSFQAVLVCSQRLETMHDFSKCCAMVVS